MKKLLFGGMLLALRIWAASYKGAEYRNVPPMEKKPSNKGSAQILSELKKAAKQNRLCY